MNGECPPLRLCSAICAADNPRGVRKRGRRGQKNTGRKRGPGLIEKHPAQIGQTSLIEKHHVSGDDVRAQNARFQRAHGAAIRQVKPARQRRQGQKLFCATHALRGVSNAQVKMAPVNARLLEILTRATGKPATSESSRHERERRETPQNQSQSARMGDGQRD